MDSNSAVSQDPYLWQHDNVLKNLAEIHDAAQLRKAELRVSPRWNWGPATPVCPGCVRFTAPCSRISTAGPVNCAPSISGAMRRRSVILNISKKRATL